MFYCNESDMRTYAKCMETMKRLNRDYYNLRKSHSYKLGMVLDTTIDKVKRRDFGGLNKCYSRWILGRKSSKQSKSPERPFPLVELEPHMYFSEERISVYTVIFGKYDEVIEPMFLPDNIDYYIITDQNVDLSKSAWQKIDISTFESDLSGLTNAEKNRYFKIKPYRVFKDYKYSIYIDGNIQVVTDLTEYVNLIGAYDIATHQHFCRDCVYDECDAILTVKKDKQENIEKHRKLFSDTGMPAHYGLMECNVIARRHSDNCKQVMESWWKEFLEYSNRDQLSLPHALFMYDIPVSDVATLGPNVFLNPSVRVVTHN